MPGDSDTMKRLAYLRHLTDAELRQTLDNALADCAMADKYEHNALLRPLIRAVIDGIWAEQARRGAPSIVPCVAGPRGLMVWKTV